MKIDSIDEIIHKVSKQINSMEYVLSKGLLMPSNHSNSGSRKQMMAAQAEQLLGLYNSELARVQTGYENRFGDRSSSLIVSDRNLMIAHKISKFSFDPNRFYYLIVYYPDENTFDIIERKEYEHITESYGILYNNEYLDSLEPGSKINKGDTIRKSLAYDEFNNRCDGVNLMATYMSMEATKEDGIVISESAAKKLASPLIKKIQIQINDNDIPLNLYYKNEADYKCFPDIGENTDRTNGILIGLRREKKEEMLFTQSRRNLSRILLSDDKYTASGTVVDIDVYCNNPETLNSSYYFSQIAFYNEQQRQFMETFIEKVSPIVESGYYCSYNLKKIYSNFKKILNGGQYLKDNVFSNTVIEITLEEKSIVQVGDKISNRYGGKGVVSAIIPDNMMPLLDNGKRVELIYNSSTWINRENNGQMNEMYLNFASNRIAEHISNPNMTFDINYAINLYIDYLEILDPNLAKRMENYILSAELDDQVAFMQLLCEEGFNLSLDPISSNINIDKLAQIKKRFPFIKQYNVMVPQIGSDGNYRYVKARRTLECGEEYIWRLKQYAEEKFSAVSLSATNLKNENTRNSSKKSFKSPYAKTCIRFGDMETGNLLHLGVEALITNLMMVSLAPKARRKLGTELTEGPIFDIDVKLDGEASNRSVEILNAYLLTIGLRIVFIKIPKRLKYPIKYNYNCNKELPKKLINPIMYKSGDSYIVPMTVGEDTLKRYGKKTLRQVIFYKEEGEK